MKLSRIARNLVWIGVGSICVFASRAQAGDSADTSFRAEVEKYLARYDATYQRLYREWREAQWNAQTHVAANDDVRRKRVVATEKALVAFTGSIENIELSRTYGKHKTELPVATRRELETIEYLAGANPAIVPDLVSERITTDAAQMEALVGFEYTLQGRRVSTQGLANILRTSDDLAVRRSAWASVQEVGPNLRAGLMRSRWLRNQIVQCLGHRDYFAYRASEYGLKTGALLKKLDEIERDLRPLYTELHTYMRYELAKRYGQPVPDLIPAHWLPDACGNDWSALLVVEGNDVGAQLAHRDPRALLDDVERFYVSTGFEKLPAAFWELSSFSSPLSAQAFSTLSAQRAAAPSSAASETLDVRNVLPSAWHVDLARDVRVLMSAESNRPAYGMALREFGEVYYDLTCSNPEVPIVLRKGANRAFPIAVGTLMELAANQPRCAVALGLGNTDAEAKPDSMQVLFAEALRYVVFVPWSAGTVCRFEHDIYANDLASDRWNTRWWELVAQHQGIAPPEPRDERWCDAASAPHVVDDPASSYDEALGHVLAFQLHDHIARKLLDLDPHDTNYYGRREVAEFLKSILRGGATFDWRQKLREKTGYDMSARAMVDYFEPLQHWLVEQNRGRKSTLPPL